ncbi:OmpH family outer membrane protein [Pontibacter sp. BT310]|uniref:OmpH family outer membrane protein n=2 Tax=Hymenobacteraceae TaxID=1853232 RepID=A0ABS6XFU0_9BACT|nr:OmpH family outer membrane protein [Pontibacter sp. BT310]MBJ6119999.1 OmpH family outer membrane protein [Pontibacter sp. BT310]MBW3366852.1 OmpH family outer membrane protein [Pontibacter populi]
MASLSLAACKQEPVKTENSTATPPSETSAEAAPVGDVVYVNADTLLANYDLFKDVKTRLQGKAQKAESDLKGKASAFEKEVGQYQQRAAGMTQEQRAVTEQRLARRQQELANLNQSESNRLMSEESEEQKKIYDKVEAFLKDYSKEKGYKMVLSYSRGNSAILYSDESLDITEDVLKGLNEAYAKEKTAPKEEAKTEAKKK